MYQLALPRVRRSLFALFALAVTLVAARPAHAAVADQASLSPAAGLRAPGCVLAPQVEVVRPGAAAAIKEERCWREGIALGIAVVELSVALATVADSPTPGNLNMVVSAGAAVYTASTALNACLNRNAE